jgi:hypothetical protein
MKRFLGKFALLAALCATLLLIVSPFYLMLLNTDYQRDQELTLKFKYMPEKIDVACFGSSHAGNAFQETRYRENGTMFNFYMQFQSPVMDKALYDYSKSRFSEHAIVVIDLSYFSLYHDDTTDLSSMKRYVTFLPLRNLPSLTGKLFKLFRAVDFSFNPIWTAVTGKTAEIAPMQTTTTASRFSAEELRAMGAARAETFLSYTGDQTISKRIDRALRGMLEDCIARGYRPVFVTTPYLTALTDGFSPEFLAHFRADCLAYAKEYGIPYLDYSHDARFSNSPEFFVDTDHLSSDGSELFMKIFFEDLKAYYPEN